MIQSSMERSTGSGTSRRAAIATACALVVAMAGGAAPALGSAVASSPATAASAPVVNGDILVTINGNLYLIKPNGTNLRKLTTGGHIADAEFSPDGRRIAFHKRLADGKQYLFVRSVAGGGVVKLGQGSNPSWSPDGTRLAFINSRGVCVMPVRAGASSKVLVANYEDQDGPVVHLDVDWSRSGGRMAVTRWYYIYEHRLAEVNVVSDRTGAIQRTHDGISPEFSRDGSALAVQRYEPYSGPEFGVDIVDVATGAVTELTPRDVDRRTYAPIWSPDGSRLAVRENGPARPDDGILNLATISATDGSVIATLIPGSTGRNIIPRDWRAAS